MSQKVIKHSVFISSPGDVQPERSLARDVIARWNEANSQATGVILEPLMWETHVQPDMDRRAQQAINEDLLGNADLLIGILWSRLGTPTDRFESGTAEEIMSFPGRKHVYFSNRAAVLENGQDPQEFAQQVEKVRQFKNEVEHQGLAREFSTHEELQSHMLRSLTQWVSEQPRQSDPANLISCEKGIEHEMLLQEWNRSGEEGLVLLFNVELFAFQDWLWFDRVWGKIGDLRAIKKVFLLLPKYKIDRLVSLVGRYRERFLAHPSHDLFHVCEIKESCNHNYTTSIGAALFRVGDDPCVGQLHLRGHIYVYSPPFSRPSAWNGNDRELSWTDVYALEVNGNTAMHRSLEELWNEQYDEGETERLVDLLNGKDEETKEKEEKVQQLIRVDPLQLGDVFETTLGVRVKLFEPNVPSYVLDENYYLLDWNPAFELIFPTHTFHRGQSVAEFLKCLKNYDEVLVRGQEFLDRTPLYHAERFVYESPVYGEMLFTKMTSPVTDDKTGEFMGWNLLLNVDRVERAELYGKHRQQATEVDALISRYAAAYDRITTEFPPYNELVDLHVEAMAAATTVLDVGAGAGLLTRKLLEAGKNVTATDNNDEMLMRLRSRCCDPKLSPKLRINKVNVEVLNGLDPIFDGAVMLNVLFTLPHPQSCLRRIFQLLKPRSAFALSGPRADANVDAVFQAVDQHVKRRKQNGHWTPEDEARWLSDRKVFREVNQEFRRKKMISRYDLEQTVAMLHETGFEISEQSIKDDVYAGQGVFLVAHRP